MEQTKPDTYKFYDSDADSCVQRDFQSDSQPPKDQLRQRKLLRKDKFLHIYKSIYRLGFNIDKPARYDLITTRIYHPDMKPTEFILSSPFITFNLGLSEEYEHIEELLVSMKKGEIALFQAEHLKTGESHGMKVLDYTTYYVIEMKQWTTVIDLYGDRRFMKQVKTKGEGGERVALEDQVKWRYEVKWGEAVVDEAKYEEVAVQVGKEVKREMPSTVWVVLVTMKVKEESLCVMDLGTFLEHETNPRILSRIQHLKQQPSPPQSSSQITIHITVISLHKIEDVLFDQTLLKKTLRKGISTARPQETSIVYYAIQWLNDKHQTLKKDEHFDLEIEELEKIQQVQNVRHNYLDEYRVSKMMKRILFRVKPLEIAEVVCRRPELVAYGEDYKELVELGGGEIRFPVRFRIKMFNFTEGKTAYNMTIEQKLFHCERKKKVGISLLNNKLYPKARKQFQDINTFFQYGIQNPSDRQLIKDAHLACLLNTSLCCLKMNDHIGVINVCLRVKNLKPSEKCTYRLASAYKETGEAVKGLKEIEEWEKMGNQLGEEMGKLREELRVKEEEYRKKAKKMFTSMFKE